MKRVKYKATLWTFDNTTGQAVGPNSIEEELITRYDRPKDILAFLYSRAVKLFSDSGSPPATKGIPDALTVEILSTTKIEIPKVPWTGK